MSLPTSPTFRRSGIAALALAALTLSACSATAPATPSETTGSGHGAIDVQLSWILNEEWSGELIAEDAGYFTDAGFSSVTFVPGPASGIPELLSGSVEVSVTDALSVGAAVANESAPLKIIGATFQQNPFTIASLTDGADIRTPQDMVGRKIGVQDSNRPVFDALLAANGLTPADVDIVPVQYDPSPLANGEVDGLIAFVTSQSVALKLQGLEITDLLFAENGLPFVGHVVTATEQTVAERPEILKAFLEAEVRGWNDAVADPARGADLALARAGSDLGLRAETSLASATAQVDLLVQSDETAENGLFTISTRLQEQTVQSLTTAGYAVTVDGLFDLSLLDEVYAENPDLRVDLG